MCAAMHVSEAPTEQGTKRLRPNGLSGLINCYDLIRDADVGLFSSSTPLDPFSSSDPSPASFLSTTEIWYHVSAISKMYREQGKPLPSATRTWVRKEIDLVEHLCYLDPDAFIAIPVLKLVTIYGIYYGVHSELEQYCLSKKRNLDNYHVAPLAKRMCIVLSMRDYINRHWDCLVDERASDTAPCVRRGELGVSCSFYAAPSILSSSTEPPGTLTAEVSFYGDGPAPTTRLKDIHPFSFSLNMEECLASELPHSPHTQPPQPPIQAPSSSRHHSNTPSSRDAFPVAPCFDALFDPLPDRPSQSLPL